VVEIPHRRGLIEVARQSQADTAEVIPNLPPPFNEMI